MPDSAAKSEMAIADVVNNINLKDIQELRFPGDKQNRGVMAPFALISDRRILQNVHQATVRYAMDVAGATGLGVAAYDQYVLFSDGIGDASASNTGISGNLTLVQTTADTDGFLHPDCSFIGKAIAVIPASLVLRGTSTAATAVTEAVGVSPLATGAVNQAFCKEYVDLFVTSFFQSYSAALQLEGESCTLDLGNLYTLMAGAGLKGGAFVANGEPLAEAFRFLPFYVKFPPGTRRNKPLTIVLTQNEVNNVLLDPALTGATDNILYMDFKFLVYGRLACEEVEGYVDSEDGRKVYSLQG